MAATKRTGVGSKAITQAEIVAAIRSGPVIDATKHPRIPRGAPSLGRHPLRGADDDTEVRFNFTDRELGPNVIEVRTFKQLEALRQTLYRAAQKLKFRVGEREQQWDEQRLVQVREQAQTIMDMGADGVVFGIKFAWHNKRGGDRLVYQMYVEPTGLETTKLGVAAIAASASEPSRANRALLAAMGYGHEPVPEVGSRISLYNQAILGTGFPHPRSLAPGGGKAKPSPPAQVVQ